MLQGKYQVGLEFCLIYTMLSFSSLCILPWSLFLLSWHLYQAGIRATGRALAPDSVTGIFRNMVPSTRVIIESEVTSVKSGVIEQVDGRPSKHQKRLQMKAKMMEDGPRQSQSTVIIVLWIGRNILPQTTFSPCKAKSQFSPIYSTFALIPTPAFLKTFYIQHSKIPLHIQTSFTTSLNSQVLPYSLPQNT